MQLLGPAGLRQLLTQHGVGGAGISLDTDDDDDHVEDSYGGLGTRRKRRPRGGKAKFEPVPSEEGRKLMASGAFGASEDFRDRTRKRKTRLSRKLMSRELGNDHDHSAKATSAISQV